MGVTLKLDNDCCILSVNGGVDRIEYRIRRVDDLVNFFYKHPQHFMRDMTYNGFTQAQICRLQAEFDQHDSTLARAFQQGPFSHDYALENVC